jgi:hypothetical protein
VKLVPVIISWLVSFILIPIKEAARTRMIDDGATDSDTWTVAPWKCFQLQVGIFLLVSIFCYLYKPLRFLLDDNYLHATFLKWDKVDEAELTRFGPNKLREDPVNIIKKVRDLDTANDSIYLIK